MGVIALLDCYAYVHAHDFTTDTNQAVLTSDARALDRTTFGSGGWTELHGGLKSWSFAMQGLWQAGDAQVDPEAFGELGTLNRVFTVGPVETEGQVAYIAQGGKFAYELGGQLGELAPFTLTSPGTSGRGLIRGQLAKARGTVSATGQLGTGLNLGAGSAGKFLYATRHVFAAATSIVVDVESDDNSGFTTPTVRASFPSGPPGVGGASFLAPVDVSAVTDTWWRLRVSSITGTHTVAGAIAIQ